jgi:hypothetical protein
MSTGKFLKTKYRSPGVVRKTRSRIKSIPRRLKHTGRDIATWYREAPKAREAFDRLVKGKPIKKGRNVVNQQLAKDIQQLQQSGKHAHRAVSRLSNRAWRLSKGGMKVAAAIAVTGTALHGAAKAQSNFKSKRRFSRYDVYPEHGYAVANTSPYRTRYSEPVFNVYEAVLQDLLVYLED